MIHLPAFARLPRLPRPSLVALFLTLGCAGAVRSAESVSPAERAAPGSGDDVHAARPQTVHRYARTLTRNVGYQYLLALPAGYEAAGEKRWPLILFLHGSGERGDDIWQVARHGPPNVLRSEHRDTAGRMLAENFVVVSPQCPKGEWWDPDAVLGLLDEIMATHRIDPRRVYLTGLSMGGYGTWALGFAHPERFAAIAPVCGGGTFATVFAASPAQRQALRTLGIWAFHGARDETVPLLESQRLVDLMKKAKAEDVRLTVYPEAKHDSWTETYANPELYTWLLRHERQPGKTAQ